MPAAQISIFHIEIHLLSSRLDNGSGGYLQAIVGPSPNEVFEEPCNKTREILPTGDEGFHFIVYVDPAGIELPGVRGAVNASKPAV
jgi:hypothetical protein